MATKRIVTLAGLALVFGLIVWWTQRPQSEVLRICTWSNYFPQELVDEFTQATGIPVEFSYITSNEELFAKMRAGASGYDLVQPSDYMVRQMSALGMLETLDHSALPGLSHIDPYFQNLAYDPGLKYSVPFTWGTTGIAINTSRVNLSSPSIGWDFLLNAKYPRHTSLLDDMREVFAATLLQLGKDINTRDNEVLGEAQQKIQSTKTQILAFSSEPRALLLKEEVWVAHIFSTDAFLARKENPKIAYFIPKEGAVLWTDNFVIPKTSMQKVAAHRFIEFFLEPNRAAKLVTQNQSATPNADAKKLLTPEMQADPNLYPAASTRARLHLMQDLGETLEVVNRLWTEVKS